MSLEDRGSLHGRHIPQGSSLISRGSDLIIESKESVRENSKSPTHDRGIIRRPAQIKDGIIVGQELFLEPIFRCQSRSSVQKGDGTLFVRCCEESTVGCRIRGPLAGLRSSLNPDALLTVRVFANKRRHGLSDLVLDPVDVRIARDKVFETEPR
jgi:hypothetical protein